MTIVEEWCCETSIPVIVFVPVLTSLYTLALFNSIVYSRVEYQVKSLSERREKLKGVSR